MSRVPSAPASRAIASRAGGLATCPGSQAQARHAATTSAVAVIAVRQFSISPSVWTGARGESQPGHLGAVHDVDVHVQVDRQVAELGQRGPEPGLPHARQAYWNGAEPALNRAAPQCMACMQTPIAASRSSTGPGFRATRWHQGTGKAAERGPLRRYGCPGRPMSR